MSNKHKNKMSKKQHQQHTGETTIRQLRQVPGVMSCIFEHKTRETTADFEWSGPQLNAIWPEVLAFFKWTNDTMHSESQVRLFVNVATQEWRAWAFPQKANLGMTAKEITQGETGYERTIEQRAMFPDPDWYYWGTVHHHCNSAAFQSGTDQMNERDQDGIHITVGNLGSPMFDIHCRLYVDKFKLVFNLTDFWDIGEELAHLPRHISRLLRDDAFNEMAKLQMGQPPALDQTFPEIWKENVIDCTPKQVVPVSQPVVNHRGYDPGNVQYHLRPLSARGKPNFEMDLRKAAAAMCTMIESPNCTINSLGELISTLRQIEVTLDDEMIDLMDIMAKHDVIPGNLADWMEKARKDSPKDETKEIKQATQNLLDNDYSGGREWEGLGH